MTITTLALAALAAVQQPAPAPPPTLTTTIDSARGEIVIAVGPMDLPANAGHDAIQQPPVLEGAFPERLAVHGFRTEVVDMHGGVVPSVVIHHINLIDPTHRELFLPISRRLLAVGHETGSQRVPGWLIGMPVEKGQRFLYSAMVHNPTDRGYHGVTIKLVLPFRGVGMMFPLVHVYPFQFDVLFPAGDKSFDLPPGSSSRSWEGSPAIPGRILAVGGHLHDLGVRLLFEDLTAGKVIWDARPIRDSAGALVGIPVGRLYRRLGAPIYPSHRYRLTAYYENPTADTVYEGGMGVIGGMFWPAEERWPAADTTDALYRRDLSHALRQWPHQQARLTRQAAATTTGAAPSHTHHH